MDTSDVIARFTSVTARKAEHASGHVRICGAVIDVDEATGQAKEIQRLNLTHQA
jgi:calcineurin-like phosphoesterase